MRFYLFLFLGNTLKKKRRHKNHIVHEMKYITIADQVKYIHWYRLVIYPMKIN